MNVFDFVVCGVSALVISALVVGTILSTGGSGPNCPPPVPSDWLGFCADYPN